jgi:hypothetical protein
MNVISWATMMAFLSLAAIVVVAQVPASGGELVAEHVRLANDRFRDVAVAIAEGYAPGDCASGLDGGAISVRFVNTNYLKDHLVDIKRPQAVLYEPTPDGEMDLVAVHYIAFEGPASLEGQPFHFVGAPNRYGSKAFYELPVWAWKANPRGTFADMNPSVRCDYVKTHARPFVLFDLD